MYGFYYHLNNQRFRKLPNINDDSAAHVVSTFVVGWATAVICRAASPASRSRPSAPSQAWSVALSFCCVFFFAQGVGRGASWVEHNYSRSGGIVRALGPRQIVMGRRGLRVTSGICQGLPWGATDSEVAPDPGKRALLVTRYPMSIMIRISVSQLSTIIIKTNIKAVYHCYLRCLFDPQVGSNKPWYV